jgi:hypothetical protein
VNHATAIPRPLVLRLGHTISEFVLIVSCHSLATKDSKRIVVYRWPASYLNQDNTEALTKGIRMLR